VSQTAVLRPLGPSDLDVHPICLGGNTFGWTTDRQASFAVLDAYVAAGGNFVDSADAYSRWVPGNSGGESETILGEWLARSGRRDEVVVATKVGSGTESLERGLRRELVLQGCDDSLRRLGTDRIDLYYAHRDDEETALEETLAAFDELVRAGKVRYVAASNYSAPRLAEALAVSAAEGSAGYVALQPRLNLVDRDGFGPELHAVCAEHGLGSAVYSSLASGFLSGKYRPGQPVPASDRAGGVQSSYLEDERALAVLGAVDEIAGRTGASVAQVALAWTIAQPQVTCAIASATTPSQIDELMGSVDVELSSADLERLTSL
jgi:aryl-alcohol dehydrogenase (NADP+)